MPVPAPSSSAAWGGGIVVRKACHLFRIRTLNTPTGKPLTARLQLLVGAPAWAAWWRCKLADFIDLASRMQGAPFATAHQLRRWGDVIKLLHGFNGG
jgi:hypothetical protein